MGNVVVSEALRNAGGQQLVQNYVASQAATVASGYNPAQPFIQHRDPALGLIDFSGPEAAWRFYNYDNNLLDTEYDMPPNHYTYTIPALHGATSPDYEVHMAQQENWGPAYYADIGLGVGRIINFYNRRDAALTAWEVNQLTKPDFADGPTYEYNWNWNCPYSPAACLLDVYPDVEDGEQVTDNYLRASQPLQRNLQASLDQDAADILGHIVPARTNALGQVNAISDTSVIARAVNLNEGPFRFGDSNQGHSAQFYNSYLARRGYWIQLLAEFGLGSAQGGN